MTSSLHVLVYGAMDSGVCDTYRFGMYRAALARRSVEIRALTEYQVSVPEDVGASEDDIFSSDELLFDRSQLDWADVIVFRRFYVTQWSCRDCALVSPSAAVLERHAALTGDRIAAPDRLIRPLYDLLEANSRLLRGRAIVYETDDDLLHVRRWNGVRARVDPERDLVRRMMRRADLATVSTPLLARRAAAYNEAVRVIRNAIDPAWYGERPSDAQRLLPGDPRLVYYGMAARFRDYEICRSAVDEVVRRVPGARRVWLGAGGVRSGGDPGRAAAAVDEVLPYVTGVREFAATLVAARPDIGLAPVVGDEFDRAKSELHWLEYAMAGAATVATRAIPGPYDVIRDGVDGFLVGTRREWVEVVTRLATSKSLREEIAGRARERVLAEYTVELRADEWADAYLWAAEHAGRGAAAASHVLHSPQTAAIAVEARAGLEYRRGRRDRLEAAPARLAELRGGRETCCEEPSTDDGPPLVSVIVPVVDEPLELVARAIGSVIGQTHARLEIVVAEPEDTPADAAADRRDHLAGLPPDPRIRVVTYARCTAPDPEASHAASAAAGSAAGVAAARGAWIAPLSPEAQFTPDHVEILLGVAREYRLEFVYGAAEVALAGAPALTLDTWPPNPDGVLTLATELFASPLLGLGTFDPEAWRDGESPGWAFWRLVVAAGARMGGIEYPVIRLAPLGSSEAGSQPTEEGVTAA